MTILKQNWTEVKKQLKHCSQNDLLGIIQELYNLNKATKAHLHLRFLAANSPEQKTALLKDTIDEIHKQWDKAFHDPYGYSGNRCTVKITPIKNPVTAYYKALGEDEGYISILAEYVIHGDKFLDTGCAEPASAAINSIDAAARDLFLLIAKNQDYFKVLTREQVKKINIYMNGYYIRDDAQIAFRKVKQLFEEHNE